jgi:hypothetical protein
MQRMKILFVLREVQIKEHTPLKKGRAAHRIRNLWHKIFFYIWHKLKFLNMKKFSILLTVILFAAMGLLKAQPVHYTWTPELAGINDLLEATDGSLWAATDSAIVQISATGQVTVHHNVPAYSVAQVGSNIWFGVDNFALRYSNGSWTTFGSGNGLPTSNFQIRSIVGVSSTVFWCVVGQQIYRFGGGTFTNTNQNGVALALDGDTLYAATSSTTEPVMKFDGTTWAPLPNIPGSIPAFVNPGLSVSVDAARNIWFQSTRGIFKYRAGTWTEVLFPYNHTGLPTLAVFDSTAFVLPLLNLIRIQGAQIDTISYDYGTAGLPGKRTIKATRDKLYITQTWNNKGYILRVFPNQLGRSDEFATLALNELDISMIPTGEMGRSPDNFTGINTTDGMLIFAAAPWVAATQGGVRKYSLNMFRSRGGEWYSGPIADQITEDYIEKYNRVWHFNRQMMETHIAQHGDSNYVTPDAISTYPGNGDVSNGEAAIIAPFADYNGNGIYEPELGEHPEIRGDEMIYAIFNDTRGPKFTSNSSGMNLEMHIVAFAFDSVGFDPAQKSLMFTYKLFNRGSADLEDVSLALFADFDIGNGIDDAMGSDSLQDIFFSYNAAPTDAIFGNNPPAIAGRFINWDLEGLMYFTNDNSATAQTGNPAVLSDFENYLTFSWRNGIPLRRTSPSGPGSNSNGTGYDPQSNEPITSWAFNHAANWHFPPVAQNDIRGLPVLKPISSLPSGSFICLDMALSMGRGADHLSSIPAAIANLDAITDYYKGLMYTCYGQTFATEPEQVNRVLPTIYPNPVSPGGHLNMLLDFEVATFHLHNLMGQSFHVEISQTSEGIRAQLPAHLPTGMYLVLISGKDGQQVASKVTVK